jgi:hypothetical protein
MSDSRLVLPLESDAFDTLKSAFAKLQKKKMRLCRDSSVGIATRYGLDGPGIESRWGRGARFSAPVQACPEAYPASCWMGTGSFLRGKAAGVWRWPPTPSKRGGWRKSRAIHLLPLLAFVACYRMAFTFIFICLSAWKESASTVRIFTKFDIWVFFENLWSCIFKVLLIPEKNRRYFTWSFMCIYDNISLNYS